MSRLLNNIKTKKFLRILRYLRPYLGIEFEILVCMLIGVVLSLIDPLVLKVIIDDVLVDKNVQLLNMVIIALLALSVFRSAFSVITSYLYSFVGQRILFDIRNQLFQHLEKLHLGFYADTKTGEIMSRVNNDVWLLQGMVTSTFISLIIDMVTLVAIFSIILYMNWRLTLLSILVFPLFAISIVYFSRRIRRQSKLTREKAADILSFFQETISGMELVQSYVREKFEARRHLRKGKEMINLHIGLSVLGSLSSSSSMLIAALGPALVFWYGGHEVIRGAMTIGGLVAFYTYVARLFGPVYRLAQLNVTIQGAMASIDRIFEFLDIEPHIKDRPGALVPSRVRGQVAFEGVTFAYRNQKAVLKDVSFRIEPGQMVAIVGPSGVGKTTIANLIFRFYDPTAGSIKLDGIDLQTIKLKFLRRQMGIVSQETVLFNTSIRENLSYGKVKANEEEMISAAKKANIHGFIESLPQGYDTLIGDRGVKLSGGQRQRLSIARAILKDPKILILDEATSSLDSQSESLIQHALELLMKHRSTLVIAHRLSTVVNADRILVLDRGMIVEQGTHEELLDLAGTYRTLWDDQMNREMSEILQTN